MRPPRKAIVLAAGFGTRMRPLTERQPKPLLPFLGRPILAHTLEMLRDWGVRDVLVNAHHLAGELVDWLRRNPLPGLAITISHEPDILGTGGPLARAAWFLDDAPFWICNGDVACRLDPAPLLHAFAWHSPLAALWMLPDRGPRTVRVADGWVTDFAVKDPGTPGTATFSGLHLVTRTILDFLPAEGFSSIIDAYRQAMATGKRVRGVKCPGSWWADLGTPEQVLQAHAEIGGVWREGVRVNKPSPTLRGHVALGRGVKVATSARLENVVVDDGAVIQPRARLRNVVVGKDTVVCGEPTRLVVPAGQALRPEECDCLARAGHPVDVRMSAECLDPRGSDRMFLRLRRAEWSGIAVRYGDQRKENEAFVPLARFLRRQRLRVPAILVEDSGLRFFVMEDLGGRDLLSEVREASERARLRLYRPVIRLAADLHGRVTRAAQRTPSLPLQPAFGPDLWRWERELFATHFLGSHGRRLAGSTPGEASVILEELAEVANRLLTAPPVLVHRDFQSTNVMLTPRGPGLIDFQGMRLGPAAYDLASLLADPYVGLREETQRALIDAYVDVTGDTATRDVLPYAAIQRLAQALGAYGRLGAKAETRRFLAFIPPALRMLAQYAAQVPGCPRLRGFLDRANQTSG